MLEIPNRNVIIPVGSDLTFDIPASIRQTSRFERRNYVYFRNETTSILAITPICTEWVQIFDANGIVVLNPRVKNKFGGTDYETYNIIGNQIIFKEPQNGYYTVVCDTIMPEYDVFEIHVDNIQGSLMTQASLFIEPVIVTEPASGYARISADRKSLVYKPNLGFTGSDGFSYCLINNHGQYSKNYCIVLNVS